MVADKRPFGERLGSWALPRMHGVSWFFVNLAFGVWVCGWAPSWLKSWLPPVPHSLRNFAAPLVALVATAILSGFIRKVLYKGINPSDPDAYYDQSNVRHFLQITFSLLVGFAVYPVILLFSEWYWIFNYIFAFGIGSFVYIAIDSSCIEIAVSQGEAWSSTPEVKVVDYRGQKPAENHEWGGWLGEIFMSPTDRQKRRQERREKGKTQYTTGKYVVRGAIDLLLSWMWSRVFNNRRTTEERPSRLLDTSVIDIEPIEDYSNYQTGSWKEPELTREPIKARERTLGGKIKKKTV